MKQKVSLITLAALSCLSGIAIAATPTITSVSGTVQTGQVLTIVGTNMVNENRANWDPFFVRNPNASSFEGTDKVADGWNPTSAGPTGGGNYDSTVSLLGNKSMKFHVAGASSNCPFDNLEDFNMATVEIGGSPNLNDLWLRFYARWNHVAGSWPTSHIKLVDSQGTGPQYYFQPENGSVRPSRFTAVHDGSNHYVNIPGGQLQNNRWYSFEIHWKSAGANVFTVWVDNTLLYNAVPASDGGMTFLPFGIINACGTNSATSIDHWWDGFAVSTSRVNLASIVEIGNSSDYATATKVYQVPARLSETSSQITVNLTGLGAGPFFLWVTNNQGERSPAISLSSTIDPPPPILR